LLFSQCEYTLENYSHNNCYGTNNGSIDITINNPNSSPIWTGPNGFTSSSIDLNNLYAGAYYLTITNSVQSCTIIDSIYIEETIDISASFDLTGRCTNEDSVNVLTSLWGGTPPYTSIWNNGTTGPNAINLPPAGSLPNVLTVTDANFCVDTIHLWVKALITMNTFMSFVGVICKDDNSGQARVFVEGGTPPYIFSWDNQIEAINDGSSSEISGLFPAIYSLEVKDDMGCIIRDSIEIKSNPNICLTIYKAFSPNDDYTNEFWKIDNIHLYPKAVISVYDRNGREVFRRRNYINSEEYAFGGKDMNDQPLPSATYYYVIDLANGDDVFKGVLTIVR
jgi:gliding motility-associated-like protein